MNEVFQNTWQWIHEDFRSNRFRFVVEVTAWSISIGCAITMALTVPTPPYSFYILFGSLVAVCMLGLLGLVGLLVCLLTIFYLSLSIWSVS
jgi:hypothetical protein